MAEITLKGNPINTLGTLPEKGSKAPEFTLIKTDLSEAKLSAILLLSPFSTLLHTG